jgi:hypothetical protein
VYDGPKTARFDIDGGSVQIDILEPYLSHGPRYKIRIRDLSKKLKLSVLAIPKLNVNTILPQNSGLSLPGVENELMDEIISARIPDNAGVFDGILIKHIVINGHDSANHRIENRKEYKRANDWDEYKSEIDWKIIEEMISAITMAKGYWNEL